MKKKVAKQWVKILRYRKELEPYSGKIIPKRPEGLSFKAWKYHVNEQNKEIKKYLKGRLVYTGIPAVPMMDEKGNVKRHVYLKGIPFKGEIKKSKQWREVK